MPGDRRPNNLKILNPLLRRRPTARITRRALALALALSVTLASLPVIPDVWAFTANGPGMISPMSTRGTAAEQRLLAELSMFNVPDVASHVLHRQVKAPLATSALRPPGTRRLLRRDRNKTAILALTIAILTLNILRFLPSPAFLPFGSALAFPGLFMACVTISAWFMFQPKLHMAIRTSPRQDGDTRRLSHTDLGQ